MAKSKKTNNRVSLQKIARESSQINTITTSLFGIGVACVGFYHLFKKE